MSRSQSFATTERFRSTSSYLRSGVAGEFGLCEPGISGWMTECGATQGGNNMQNKPSREELLDQYGCGPIQFTGSGDALYERHLLFDSVVDPATVGAREQYEAVARSVRDVLSQRWLLTEQTYRNQNPKRIYYLSMEFLIGRSLANNITNLMLDPLARHAAADKNLDWLGLLEQEPDAGLGNGGLGRLAACFLEFDGHIEPTGHGLRSSI